MKGNLLVLTRAFFVNNVIHMAFLQNSRTQTVFGKNEQSTQTPCPGDPEARRSMQLHRWHRLRPALPIARYFCEVCTWHDSPTLVTAPFDAMANREQQMRKASHCGSKQQ